MKFVYKKNLADTSKIHVRLKYAMKKRGVKQVDVAEQLGCSKQMMSFLCAGDRECTIEVACRICQILNIDLEWFITGIGEMDQ